MPTETTFWAVRRATLDISSNVAPEVTSAVAILPTRTVPAMPDQKPPFIEFSRPTQTSSPTVTSSTCRPVSLALLIAVLKF